ncbi:uncharacterized protein LOC144039388 isoform X2 [Vanacampus margaritifer]
MQSSCSSTDWLHSRNGGPLMDVVKNNTVVSSSPGSQRLRLMDDCSLLIERVMAEDAGYYGCDRDQQQILEVLLTVLTLTLQESDPMSDGRMFLKCSVAFYEDRLQCNSRSLRWMDEEGKELSSYGVQQNGCVSFLTVSPVSRQRKYTCQCVKGGHVEVEARYTVVSTEESTRGPGGPGAQSPGRNVLIFVIRAVVAALMLIFLIVAVILVKLKSKRNASQGP